MATLSFANIKENIVGVTATASTAAETSSNIISNVSSASNTLSKTFNRITVHNVLSESNTLNLNHVANGTHNTIIRKIRDFGMFGAVNNNATNKATTTASNTIAARKRPLGESKLNDENKQPKLQNSIPKKTKLQKEVVQKDKPTKSKQDKAKTQTKNATATTTTAAAAATVTALTTTSTPTTTTNAGGHVVALATPTPTSTPTPTTTPTLTQPHKPAGTPGRKGLPLPQAVARRNARERNRVKQVNNGFAALRERIPDEVSEAFEAQGNGRGSAKKLSKVETLRMAVEYIRSLERLLGFDFPVPVNSASTSCSSSSGEDSFMIIKDEYDGLDDEHYDDSMSNYELEDGNNYGAMTATAMRALDDHMQHATNVCGNSDAGSVDDANGMGGGIGMDMSLDLLPNVTTLNGLQYVRIPGTNTYQLFTADIFGGNASNSSIDEEHFNGLIDANCMSPTSGQQTAATINNAESAGGANAAPAAAAVEPLSNGECVKYAINATATPTTATTLSRSTPVPQPSPTPTGSSSLHQQESQQQQLQRQQHQQQQRQHHLQPPSTAAVAVALPITTTTTTTIARTRSKTVSPAMAVHAAPAAAAVSAAAVANELLLQTCAVDRQFVAPAATPQQQQQQQQQQHQQMIKQEFCDRNLATTTTTLPTDMQISLKQLIYQHATTQQQQQQQQHQQQLMLSHATSSMSPPTTITTTTNAQATPIAPILAMSPGLQAFYEHDHGSFYEGVVTLKKEFNDILLDTSTTAGGLSDESMIDAIDWWEAHTPKSDGGSVIM